MQNIGTHNVIEEKTMEDIASSPSIIEERDRRDFNYEIHKFMAEIGKPLSKIPIMGYKELDLYQLYKEVTAHGGFNEVVKNVGTWSKIWKRLGNFDPSITDSSFRLKKNYERYLLEYEYRCFPDHKIQALEFQEKSSMKRSSSTPNLHLASSVSRPHSPSNSSTTVSSPMFSLAGSSNTSSGTFHNSESALSPSLSRKSKGKKKRVTKSLSGSGSRTPSRSNSYNNIASLASTKLPLVIGDLTIDNLGTIIPKVPYCSEKSPYPIGFTSHRMFTSRVHPEKQVRYTSMIVEAGDRPQFVVIAADDLDNPVISNESPSDCWRVILQHFMDTNEHNASSKLHVSGHLRFGLTQPDVAGLIRELPSSDRVVGLFPPSSPPKRKYLSDDSEEDMKPKARKSGISKSASSSRLDDIDDLEGAIATLQALKYCSVF